MVAVSNGNAVVDAALHMKPDIILMDINLNGYDGRKICKELRDSSQFTIPIILFSAVPEYNNTVSEYGANGFIDKPFEVRNLIDQLHSFLN